ncbi:hypothetical protein FOL47_000387 [Perkinsus chesapeaki]|uniref:Peptidase A1 domain-containing protein n=1 Tax=Perkinsus chesapeaki TaxID=330153 RepID=A0A7J6MLV2_PERCH|nr:hypothetical protein FOL47_000387 [Perkinsus chesapeaki]
MSMLLGFLVTLTLVSSVQLIKVSISSALTDLHDVYPLPLAKLKVDGQDVRLLVDTGTPVLSLVWKDWFEDPHQKCVDIIFGCFECEPSCQGGPTKDFWFEDHACVSVFLHSGTFDFGRAQSAGEIDFGLVARFNGNPWNIWASLGLKPAADAEPKAYQSLVQQLATKNVIEYESFTVYFNEEDFASGEIILGGEDPSKRAGPLKLFKIVNKDEQFVQLHSLRVGVGDPKYVINMTYPAVFDTGSSHIFINKKWKSQVLGYLQAAGKEKFSIQQVESELVISCSDTGNVPPLTFTVEGLKGEKFLLEVSPQALVWEHEGECYLRLNLDDDDKAIVFGMPAFFGRYYHFPSNGRSIGYAKAKL